jgi:hypothetical protein
MRDFSRKIQTHKFVNFNFETKILIRFNSVSFRNSTSSNMKSLISIFLFSAVTLLAINECFSSMMEEKCAFECTDEGVKLQCSYSDRRCRNHKEHYNTQTGNCEVINCPNMSCVGKEHESFSNKFVHSYDEDCELKYPLSITDKLGCVCKEGFCRENDVCIARTVPKQEVDYTQTILYV